MRIAYIGDPKGGDNPPSVSFGGVQLPLGVAVEVENEALARKLAGNSHFRVETVSVDPEPPVKRGPGRSRKVLNDGGSDQNAE